MIKDKRERREELKLNDRDMIEEKEGGKHQKISTFLMSRSVASEPTRFAETFCLLIRGDQRRFY